jgi:hypothetical protein
MKNLINKMLKEETKDEYILEIPNLRFIPNADLENSEGRKEAWDKLLRLLNGKPFIFDDDLKLNFTNITSLVNLQSVNGDLSLHHCEKLTSLGNLQSVNGGLDLSYTEITSLGNLQSVNGGLDLYKCNQLTSLGNLQSVNGFLDLRNTPISEKYSEEEIRQMVNVKGDIYI